MILHMEVSFRVRGPSLQIWCWLGIALPVIQQRLIDLGYEGQCDTIHRVMNHPTLAEVRGWLPWWRLAIFKKRLMDRYEGAPGCDLIHERIPGRLPLPPYGKGVWKHD